LNRTREAVRANYPALQKWLADRGDIFSHVAPKAGAIAWAGLRDGRDSAKMAEELRVQKGVLLVAGEQMGMESFVRFGFGGDQGHLQKALGRIDEYLQETQGWQSRSA